MRILVLTLATLYLSGCAVDRGEIEFCGIENGRLSQEPLRFNTEKQYVLGADASYRYEVVESELAKGFVSPFPLTLPKSASTTRIPEQWDLAGYGFTATKLSSANPDWLLIHATLSSDTPSSKIQRTSVLYSLSRGVLAIRWSSLYEGEGVDSEVFFCGTGRLDASTF